MKYWETVGRFADANMARKSASARKRLLPHKINRVVKDQSTGHYLVQTRDKEPGRTPGVL